jgi:proline dehydrogenase
MGLMRSVLLAGSQNAWLREQATKYPFVRRAVSRFMPGETLDDALGAAQRLGQQKLGTILTLLGENVERPAEAEAVARHYLEALERVAQARLDAWVSVKLTQLGLDLDPELAYRHLEQIAERAAALASRVWIDMESSPYVDATLKLFRRLCAEHQNVGICLQAYLYRTAADVESLLPIGPSIRLVKGAYREPPDLAFPRKRDVDQNYFGLGQRLLSDEARRAGAWIAFGTHDPVLIQRLRDHAASRSLPADAFEFELLYGIQTALQLRLVAAGCATRVLISYGDYWFPWYMRRLAERPANLTFVLRNLLRG